MFEIEAAQERLPAAVDISGGGAGARPPQPHRFRVLLAGQVIHPQPDHGALDDRQLAGVACPGAAVFQTRMQPVPGLGVSSAVAAGVGRGRDLWWRPVLGVGQSERDPVPRWAPASARPSWRRRQAQHPVGAQPPEQFHRQVGEQERQPVNVVARVEDDQDVRVAVAVLPGCPQPTDDLPHLGGGHRGGVVFWSQPHRIEHRSPRRAPGFERGHH